MSASQAAECKMRGDGRSPTNRHEVPAKRRQVPGKHPRSSSRNIGLAGAGSGAIDRACAHLLAFLVWLLGVVRSHDGTGEQCDRRNRERLESGYLDFDPLVLQDDANLLGAGGVSFRNETVAASIGRGRRATRISGRRIEPNVPTRILEPHRIRRIRHHTPSRGRVEIKVQASVPVNVYIVKADKLGTYRDDHILKVRNTMNLSRKVDLPFSPGETWYLVIRNKSNEPAAIHYEVFY